MAVESEMLCDLWEEKLLAPLSHSRLYHLQPLGVGGPLVESLTSYIHRLATEHSVTPYVLFTTEILPCLHQHGYNMSNHLSAFWMESAAVNSMTSLASRVIQVIEQLTGHGALRFLTMLPWADVLSTRHLLRRTCAWCPTCYEEWREARQCIYEPLLWSLETVTVCSCHNLRLHTLCPYQDCARTQYPLMSRTVVGYCPWCNRWLGNRKCSETEQRDEQGNEEWQWRCWVSKVVGDMLAVPPLLSELPQRSNFVVPMTGYAKQLTGGNLSALARLLHMDMNLLWRLQHWSQRPQLETILHLCFSLNISPLSFLTGNMENASSRQMKELWSPPWEQRTSKGRNFHHDRLLHVLNDIVQSKEDPPPSMREVCRRLGHDRGQLYPHFPDHCRAISKRYLDYQTNRRVERVQKLCDEVRQAIYGLHARNHYPSRGRIGQLLKKGGVFKAPEVQVVWKTTMRELGYQL